MATVLEGCITEKQRSIVRFYGQKDSIQRIFIKICLLFTEGSVDARSGAEVAETKVKKTSILRVLTHW
jgi:hypothetical protein